MITKFTRKVIGIAAICILHLVSFCNAQSWTWARSATSTGAGYSEGFNVATDASGNLYVTGFYGPNITFGPVTLNSNAGSTDAFLAKYDPSGNVLWARSAGGSGSEEGTSVATDASRNVYLSGYFRSPAITFGATTLTNAGNSDFFLAKYDSSGNILWARGAGGSGFDETGDFTGNTVATDDSGNVFVTGYFSSATITFGTVTLTNTGGNDVFIVKYDSSGTVLWAKSATGTGNDSGTSVATDASGNVYLPGYFSSATITFGTNTLTNAGTGYSDMFLIKYDRAGNILWTTSAAVGIMTLNVPFNFCVATDNFQNVYLTGGFQPATVSFGSFTLTNNSVGGCNAFITKYDSSGTVLWAKSAGGPNYDCGYSVATDPSGYVYITGVYSLIGNTSITFGPFMLSFPAGGIDPMFIVKYDPNGNALCASSLASGGDDNNGVATDASGNAYIGGDFMVTPFFVGTNMLTLTGGEDVFVAKYVCDSVSSIPPVANFTANDTTLCGEQCVSFSDLSMNATSWAWQFAGGNPVTSSLQSPQNICYSSTGTYDVTLIATNSNGSDTLTLTNYITVYPSPTPPTFSQSGDTLFVSQSYTSYQWYHDSFVIPGATNYFYVAPASGNYNIIVADSNGCDVGAGILNVIATAPPNLPDGEGILVFPNPSVGAGKLDVRYYSAENSFVTFEFINTFGQILFKEEKQMKQGLNSFIFGESFVRTGIYFVKVNNGRKTFVQKLIIE